MSTPAVVLVGVSHKNAPVGVRECLARLEAGQVFERLREQGCGEAVVLSTCNRFEIYVFAPPERRRDAVWAKGFLEGVSGLSLSAHAYAHVGERAVLHLFEVASGLDSLVVGETEILGQVRAAYDQAKTAGMTGKHSNVLFQRALYVGKKVRNDTAIAVGQTSVASVAVQLAESIFGRLNESAVLILGAGTMAELTARHFMTKKVAALTIANRTFERAAGLAGQLKAQALEWDKFPSALEKVDIVVASTAADRPVITRELMEQALKARGGRSLFVIDIAMPRDVEDGVHELEHVYVYRLDDLEAIVAENLKSRGGEVAKARALARGKAEEFAQWLDSVAKGSEISLRHSSAEEALS